MWSGEGFNDAWVHSPYNGVARIDSPEGPVFSHLTFDFEEKNRKTVALALPKAWWDIRTNHFEGRAVAFSRAAWHELDIESGKSKAVIVHDPINPATNAPWWPHENNPRGRFFRRDADY